MRAILAGARCEVNLQAIEDRTTVDPLPLLATDVLEFATSTPGKRADVIMIRRDTWSMAPMINLVDTVVESGNPNLVDTVFVDGRIVKQDGKLVDHELSKVRRLVEEARDRIMKSAGVNNPGKWLPELYQLPGQFQGGS